MRLYKVIKCDYCGERIERKPSKIKRSEHHFCNQKCHGKYSKGEYRKKRIKVKCEYCGKPIERSRCMIERSKHHFCNLKCFGKSIRGINISSKTEFKKGNVPWNKGKTGFGKKIHTNLDVMTPSKAYIIGVLCGDGVLNYRFYKKWGRAGSFGMSSIDREFTEFFAKQIEDWLGEKIKIHHIKGGSIAKFPNGKTSIRKDGFYVQYNSIVVCRYLKKRYGNFKVKEWRVPKEIMDSSDEKIIIMYLRGIMDSEDSISISGRICIFSTNLQGLKQVQELLKKMGIEITSLRLRKDRSCSCYTLQFGKKEYRKILLEKIGVTINRKRKNLIWSLFPEQIPPKFLEQITEKNRRYYQKYKKQRREYNKKHKKQIREYNKKYSQEHKKERREYLQRPEIKKRNLEQQRQRRKLRQMRIKQIIPIPHQSTLINFNQRQIENVR